MYEAYIKYGPYSSSKKDARLRLVLKHKVTGRMTSVSYPKYLMECHLERYLSEDETVDHIDKNYTNNDIENLQILKRKDHAEKDVRRVRPSEVSCSYCGREFTTKRGNSRGSGYFCSKSCSGKYGREVQMGLRDKREVDSIEREYYYL